MPSLSMSSGIGARHLVQFEAAGFGLETQRAATCAGVAVEFGGRRAASQEHVVKAVAVAVKRGDAAADHVFPLAGVDAVDAGAGRLLDEAGDGGAILGSTWGGQAGDAAARSRQGRKHRTHDYLLVRKALM